MIKVMLFAAALALSTFAASATAAPGAQTRIEASGGSYGFMYVPQCYPTITSRCPSQCRAAFGPWRPGQPILPQWCANKADTSKHSSSGGVFSLGKFRSK